MTIYEEIKEQFTKLAKAANLNIIASNWDEFSRDSGDFKFETRAQAKKFIAIMPDGYESELLGPTSTVSVEIV